MKRLMILFLFVVLLTNVLAQETVNVTFRYYPTSDEVLRAFVPGTFNNWGPNSSGTISTTAPSLMTYVDEEGYWAKIVPLTAGTQYQYKFHEQYNPTGTSWQWFTDPLNPLINYQDNNNSIINVEKAMIFQVEPRADMLVDLGDQIRVGVFAAEGDSILLAESAIIVDDSLVSTFEGIVDPERSILSLEIPVMTNGSHKVFIQLQTAMGESAMDSTTYFVETADPEIAELPEAAVDGINYIDNQTATFVLLAPGKHFVYLIGDFNDWQIDSDYYMKMTPDSSRFWLTVTGLEAGRQYRFQYLVDGEIRIADPYSPQVSDPWNDQFISGLTYPDLIAYPEGETTEITSVFQLDPPEYEWQVTDFQRPEPEELIIYELLIRDFIAAHDYQTLIDTLSYFEKLGVTAIELMPVNEFEGNSSWGYNPSFYFAPDKYYGPANDLKRFIDECHKRGIAVILDAVLNHSFGQSPLVRLYNEGEYGQPTPENPWYNVIATHPFSVGYDFNHESELTQDFIDRVNAFWLEEYKIDGYRFDLSKGFTQNNTGGNVGEWGRYDASRISLLKRMADEIWSVDSTAYVILEHFAEDREEIELTNYGMMVWGNMNNAYSQSAMSYAQDSDLSRGYFKNRNFTKPRLVTYMESHDEPWLMYKNLQFGRIAGDYNIRELETALDRIKLVSAFFYTIPGPKMMWQFGELGYDQELPSSGFERTAPKPILWNYYQEPGRRELYYTIASLIHLRKTYNVFQNPNSTVTMQVDASHLDRRIKLNNFYQYVTIIGNFDVVQRQVNPDFHFTGTWFEYFSEDTIEVVDTQQLMELAPGAFRIYSNVKFEKPADIPSSVRMISDNVPDAFVLE
ncbi:hypothetical protein GF337_06470, partial [candidate division KSB1 bacterium]|nr:hypothetical protein [candidate division KSB1 bacterium]